MSTGGGIQEEIHYEDELQNSRENITQNPKPQFAQISLSYNRDYSPKDRNTNSSFVENR
jgi:hypothetical protein